MAKLAKTMLLLSLISITAWSPPSSSQALPSTTDLHYHNGPVLTSAINIYLTWYGSFSPSDKAAVSDFFSSFHPSPSLRQTPTVPNWWSTIRAYKDKAGKPASGAITLAGQHSYTSLVFGKGLKREDLTSILSTTIANGALPLDANGVYFILTASDITVDKFCVGSCGFHGFASVFPAKNVVFAHVGDPAAQCPGLCAWPFAVPAYGPPGPPLVPPNGAGADGMVMNIATVLAGAATNPTGDGWYQGDRLAPLEAVTACPGIFGAGAYPGYPGDLMVDGRTKASFNVYGAGGRKYLVPAIWDLVSGTCKVA